MVAKAKDWAEQLQPNLLYKHDVLPLIRSTSMKKLEYPMAQTTLDAQQWTDIMSPVLQVCLLKAGVCRNFPRDVVFAPLSYQGLGLPHPFGCQVFKHLEMLLRHIANRTKTGDYMEANFQAHQLETGTSFGLLQQVYNNTEILASDTWMKGVWHELKGLNIYVVCDLPALSHRCTDDSLLMDLFFNLEVEQEERLWLNWCQMFLQVCTVSDIVTADGRFHRRSVWNGLRDECCRSPYQWPRTVRPTWQHWNLWQTTLSRALFAPTGHITHSNSHWGPGLTLWRTGIGCCHPLQAISTAMGQPGNTLPLRAPPPRHVATHQPRQILPAHGGPHRFPLMFFALRFAPSQALTGFFSQVLAVPLNHPLPTAHPSFKRGRRLPSFAQTITGGFQMRSKPP
ncbi:unnamed protein product [Cylindrotheca closterium]|uniref:Uncharacterized protein n=1 Tax=Cylindrotheca closterium TaxID=2856 RepID=A0AAD2FE12_9STRA|nr:unnamed protein product [Cylindrotheca closterium]